MGGYSQDARFNFPVGLTLDLEGSVLVIDTCNHALRKVLSKGQVTTVLGSPHKDWGFADGKVGEEERCAPLNPSPSHFHFLLFFSETIIHINTIIEVTTSLGALWKILFVDVSPPASLLDCSLCLDTLSLSDAYSRTLIGPPGIGGLVEDDHHARSRENGIFYHLVAVSVHVTFVYRRHHTFYLCVPLHICHVSRSA